MTREKCCRNTLMNSDSPTSQIHVLVVDDCLIDRKIMEKLLRMMFFKVTVVESAVRALEVLGVHEDELPDADSNNLQNLKVNLIVTDYCMPGMNGYDLLKKVKETEGLKEIPVVMMSSEDVPQRIKRCLDEGADDFMMKPLQIADIKKLKNHIKPSRSFYSSATRKKLPPRRLAGKGSDRQPGLSGIVFA